MRGGEGGKIEGAACVVQGRNKMEGERKNRRMRKKEDGD